MSNSSLYQLSQRTGPLSDRLRALGYGLEEAYINGRLLMRLTSPTGKVWLTGTKASLPMISHEVYQLTDNKQLSYSLAELCGVNIPRTIYVESASDPEVVSLIDSCDRVVVKPLDSYHSKGVTCNITDLNQAALAIEKAQQYSPLTIVQEQVTGSEYRFTVIDGQVVSVIKRQNPSLTGDGQNTISTLLADENAARSKLDLSYIEYPQLDKSNIDLPSGSYDRVLRSGEKLTLSSATMVSSGASFYEVIDETHSQYKAYAASLAASLATPLVVVDMFMVDHQLIPETSNYWFNEFNSAPSLKVYHAVRNRDCSWVADRIVNMLHESLTT